MNAEKISLLLQCVYSRVAVLWTDLSVFFALSCVCVCSFFSRAVHTNVTSGLGEPLDIYKQNKF